MQHESTTDPSARLFKQARGQAAKLCHMAHVLMQNRNGVVVDAPLTHATGTAERKAAPLMLGRIEGRHRIPLGMDENYDAAAFVEALRKMEVTPHVAQNNTTRRSAIDGYTTRHHGYALSQKIRKRIEEEFAWGKNLRHHAKSPTLRARSRRMALHAYRCRLQFYQTAETACSSLASPLISKVPAKQGKSREFYPEMAKNITP